MRGLLFIGLLVALVYFLVLKKDDVERFDLDKAENQVEQVEQQVNDAMQEAQDKLDKALDNK